MNIAERIDLLMKLRGIRGQSALARASGVPQPTINRILKGTTANPDLTTVQKLAVTLSSNTNWIVDGIGPGPDSPDHRPMPITEHAAETSKPSKNAPKTGEFASSVSAERSTISGAKFDANVAPVELARRQIPVISYVQAGMMTEVVDPFSLGQGFETIQPTVECSENSFALKIEGESMEPRFSEGDVVIIDPHRAPRPGNFVVAKNGREEATFKKYRPRGTDEHGNVVFELVPLNDDYPTLHSERDHLHIIGVCVELRQKMV